MSEIISSARVPVALGERSYDITIDPGLLGCLAEHLVRLKVKGKVGVVTDRHVARHYITSVVRTLSKIGAEPLPMVLPPGERAKTLGTIQRILDTLAKHRFERSSWLVALGGGVVGDLTGFAAAIYQRGIPFVQIPTTLVAQVDSSVGGKTGVDHRLGKNLIGAFYQPRGVFIDPLSLRTLPEREWIAGLSEVIKYGVIADEAFFTFLGREMPAIRRRRAAAVAAVIKRSCEIKASVVAADEHEGDRRRILNYGHTIGHALEALGGYRGLIHGEAVGIGLVQEAELAAYQGLCDRTVVDEVRTVVEAAGLRADLPPWPPRRLWKAMLHDKKVSAGQVIGVWPEKIGHVRIAPLPAAVFLRWCAERRSNTTARRDR